MTEASASVCLLLATALLVVSAPDSGSRGPGSSPDRVIVLCSWAKHWVPANCQGNLTKCWGVICDGIASHTGGVAILLVASCYRNRDKLRQLCEPGSWLNRLRERLTKFKFRAVCFILTPSSTTATRTPRPVYPRYQAHFTFIETGVSFCKWNL